MAVHLGLSRTLLAGLAGMNSSHRESQGPHGSGSAAFQVVPVRAWGDTLRHMALGSNPVNRVTWIVRYPDWWLVSLWHVTQQGDELKYAFA